jgi:PAS domain S-box-containing protein
MSPAIQETLLQLFELVQNDPDSIPPIPYDAWDEGSAERKLLESFRAMAEHVQERINQLRQTEEQLFEREEQYRSIFEAATDGILIVELKESRLVEVNPSACELFGRTREEFLGRVVGMSDDSQTPPVYAHDVVKAGGRFEMSEIGTRKDGKSFYAEIRAFPIPYKGEPHMLVIVHDITAQVRAREREEQYSSIFEASTDGMLVIELEESRVVEANPKACQLAGYSREEFLGRIVGLRDDSQTPPVYARDVVRSGGLFQKRGMATSRAGETFYAEYSSSPFFYKGKTHMLQIIHDITAQVHEEVPHTLQPVYSGQMQAEESLYGEEEQYRSIFEAVVDGLLIINPENDSVVEVNPGACEMFGYSREDFLGQVIIPSDDTQQHSVYARDVVRAGGLFQMRKRLAGKGEKTFDAEVRASPFSYKGLLHMLVVVRDITAQVQAEQQLREREAQYRSIFEAVTDGILIVDLHDRYLVEVNPRGCQMFGYSREEFLGQIISLMDNTQKPPVYARDVIQAGGLFHTRDTGRSKDGRTFYMEAHASPFTYKGQPHMLVVVRDITEQVQAQQLLEQRVEERTRELSTLLEVSHNVASTLELKPLLNLILNQIKDVVEYTAATILIRDGAELAIVDYLGPAKREAVLKIRYSVRSTGVDDIVLRQGEPVIIDDVRASTPLAQDYREAVGDMLQIFSSYQRALLVVPLKLKDRVIGMLSMASNDVGCYTPHHASLIVAIANQAAIAIENARLYEQAQTLASIEERQRLARELHDSVSQALYGISLGVHTARMQLDRDPKDIAVSLDYVLELADAALIEMRALIFELRPESLETEGLVTALTKQSAALRARQNIEVITDLCAEPDLQLKVKQDLYRIAQEAMHNTVKHAHANKIVLRLYKAGKMLAMEICDNGEGFDAKASFPGHLGLHSMRERVAGHGGELQIESTPGQGTCIRVQVPCRDAM